jgi:hypothetical protein
VGAQQPQRLGVVVVIGDRPGQQLPQPRVGRIVARQDVQMPSRRSVPGVLPDCADSDATSRMSSESWKATPIFSHAEVSVSTTEDGAPAIIAPNWPDVAIREAVLSATTCR